MLPLGKPDAPLRVRRSSPHSAHRKSIYRTRVNLITIVRLAARRKGITRSAAVHLDCVRFARGEGRYRFTPRGRSYLRDGQKRLALAA